MKKIISIILAAVVLSMTTAVAQTAQKSTGDIVKEVVAAMPAANHADFVKEMEILAKGAPATVQYLASKLQPAEAGANNLYEYALSGVANYVCSEGKEYKTDVLTGLGNATMKCTDKYNKQFIESLVHLVNGRLNPEEAPEIDKAELEKKAKALLSSSQSNERCEAVYIYENQLGGFSEKQALKALKSSDRAFRAEALRASGDDEAFAAKLASKFKSVDNDTKVDILNYFTVNKSEAQLPTVIEAMSLTGEPATEAIATAGKLGGDAAVDALIGQLSRPADGDFDYATAAKKALLSCKTPSGDKIAAALNTAKAGSQESDNLLEIAEKRKIASCYDKVFSLADTDANALSALKGVASAKDFDSIADKLETVSADKVPAWSDALCGSIVSLDGNARFAKVADRMKKSAKPERFYKAIASSETDEAAATLNEACKSGSKEAAEALSTMKNKKALEGLRIAALNGDEQALSSYVKLLMYYKDANRIDELCANLVEVLNGSKTPTAKAIVLKQMGNAPTASAFDAASKCLDDPATKIDAAYALKSIANYNIDKLDYNKLVTVMTKAQDALKERHTADDMYAVDEINTIIASAEKPSPVFTLSDEEKAAGYEMLFDGTNLDKWTGNKGGYQISNNNIYVTAGYGNGGNLYTEKEYRDFVFRFEFSFVRPGANNGVGVRTPQGVDAAYGGMCEVQVLDHDNEMYSGWLKPYQVHGSVYGVIPAKRIKHKATGEWSTEEIEVKGDHVKVTVNGEVIVDGDVREACQGHNVAPDGSDHNPYTVDGKNHPGMFNEKGYIGFLGHGAGVRFRNVRVLDLGGMPVAKTKKTRKK